MLTCALQHVDSAAWLAPGKDGRPRYLLPERERLYCYLRPEKMNPLKPRVMLNDFLTTLEKIKTNNKLAFLDAVVLVTDNGGALKHFGHFAAHMMFRIWKAQGMCLLSIVSHAPHQSARNFLIEKSWGPIRKATCGNKFGRQAFDEKNKAREMLGEAEEGAEGANGVAATGDDEIMEDVLGIAVDEMADVIRHVRIGEFCAEVETVHSTEDDIGPDAIFGDFDALLDFYTDPRQFKAKANPQWVREAREMAAHTRRLPHSIDIRPCDGCDHCHRP